MINHHFYRLLGKSGFLHFFKTVPPTSVTFCVLGQSWKNDPFWKTGFCPFSSFFHVFSCFFINLSLFSCFVSSIYVMNLLCLCHYLQSSYYDDVYVTYLWSSYCDDICVTYLWSSYCDDVYVTYLGWCLLPYSP